ncbi:hypothetical protein RIF29_16765 [Crotalaria pallida]|uniref:Uncharacterized protein n=1 Tax=Crotalaria pallida TaxID=3830 RepID=A0AAN9FH43_CROPI
MMKNTYDLGARSFWIHNTGPIGCLPLTLANFPSAEKDEYGCAKVYNELAQSFNQQLKEGLAQLRNDLPKVAITYVDIYSAKFSLFQDPKKYGFDQPHVACCGFGGEYNYNVNVQCSSTVNVNGTEISVGSCGNPSVRIVWDGIHYTEAANKIVFNKISTGAFTDPPVPLNMSYTGGFTASLGALNPPYGETYFHRPAGRYSDGRIILDFIGPLGCHSSFLASFLSAKKDGYGCAKALNEVCQYFNQQLKEALAQLRKDLPDAAITYVDIYSAKYSLFQDPKKYGFEQPHAACCGIGGKLYNYNLKVRRGESMNINGTKISAGSCGNPSVRIMWDGTHYTEAANKVVFDKISSGAFTDPPVPLNMACRRSFT